MEKDENILKFRIGDSRSCGGQKQSVFEDEKLRRADIMAVFWRGCDDDDGSPAVINL
jgi:hypothetical protein